MRNVYLHSEWSIKRISKYILLSLIPLILGGFYKNGIKLYMQDFVGIYGLFKPLILTIIGFIIGVLVNLIYEYIVRKRKDTFINTVFSSFHPVYGVLIASILNINVNIYLFSGVCFLLLLFSKYFKNIRLNITSLIALIIILITSLLSDFTFLNAYEASKVLHLNVLDYLVGMGSGGINTTYVVFLIFSLIILSNQDYYKKSIPLYSIVSYSILMFSYGIFKQNINLALGNIFGYGILFAFVYLAPDSLTSSYTKKGQAVYGVVVGVFTFGLFLIYPPLASLGAIFIASMMNTTIDKFCLK